MDSLPLLHPKELPKITLEPEFIGVYVYKTWRGEKAVQTCDGIRLIDYEIADFVEWLNKIKLCTSASCAGHLLIDKDKDRVIGLMHPYIFFSHFRREEDANRVLNTFSSIARRRMKLLRYKDPKSASKEEFFEVHELFEVIATYVADLRKLYIVIEQTRPATWKEFIEVPEEERIQALMIGKHILSDVYGREVTLDEVIRFHFKNARRRVQIEIWPKKMPTLTMPDYLVDFLYFEEGDLSVEELDYIRYYGLLWLYKEILKCRESF